jgi:tetratricopeptide (TPR) repeat protein
MGHDDSFTRFAVLSSLALLDVARGERSVDPGELADLARRMDNDDGLARAAWLASVDGEEELAGAILDELVPRALVVSAPLLSRVCLRLNRRASAVDLLSRWVASYPAQQAAVHDATAVLAEADGDFQTARTHYGEAARIFEETQALPDHASAKVGLGRCLLALGETAAAVDCLTDARELWDGLGASSRVSEIDTLLSAATRS